MTKITQLSQLDLNGTYTYADYLTWQFDEALELIKGKIMLMSSTPSVAHQSISLHLTGILYQFFQYKDCRFFAAPFDVRLYDKNQSEVVNHDCMAAGDRAMPGAVPRIFIRLYSLICASLVIAINWTPKAVSERPIGSLKFYRKGILKKKCRSNMSCIRKMA